MITIFQYMIVLISELAIIPTGNYIERKIGKCEIARKWSHIVPGEILWVTSYTFFQDTIHFLIVPTLFAIISTSLIYADALKSDNREDPSLNNKKSTILYGIACIILSGLTLINKDFLLPYGIAIHVLIFGDAFAAIIGSKYGKYSIQLPNNKSLTGSIAFILASIIGMIIPICMLDVTIALYKIILIAIVGSIVEVYSGEWDNILIPIVVGLLVFIII